jgi:hypothetical protein
MDGLGGRGTYLGLGARRLEIAATAFCLQVCETTGEVESTSSGRVKDGRWAGSLGTGADASADGKEELGLWGSDS